MFRLRWAAPLLCAVALYAQAPSPADRAKQAVELVVSADYEKFLALCDDTMRNAAPLEKWQALTPVMRGFGAVQSYGTPKAQSRGAMTIVVVPVKFANAAIDFTVSLNADARIAGFFFKPAQAVAAYTAAPYVKPDSFAERSLTVGNDEWKLSATLTLPKGAAKVRAVVLVHGSGPHDGDETINGGNKPFRDLAEGLASRGIAVLRYEKRTHAHGAALAKLSRFTVQEEVVEDAVRAANLLKSVPEIDATRIYVLGHSLGGYVLPRILEQASFVAGGISLAGSTRPLEDLIVEQVEYVAPLRTNDATVVKNALDGVRSSAAQVKALTADTLTGAPILNISRAYWFDLKNYNPPALAAKLHAKMLVLQGERDYQVTMVDFANWRNALGSSATYKSYPALNHLFQAGTGKQRPEEFEKPGHIDAEVIADIAAWVAR